MTGDRPHVRVEPAMRFGQPHVKGISVEAIGGMVRAEQSPDIAADEYGLTRADILVACWYLGQHGTRAWRRRWGSWADTAGQQMWRAGTVNYDEVPDPPLDGAQ